MRADERVPIAIRDMIAQVVDETQPLHVRENVAARLELTAQAAMTAAERFRNRKPRGRSSR